MWGREGKGKLEQLEAGPPADSCFGALWDAEAQADWKSQQRDLRLVSLEQLAISSSLEICWNRYLLGTKVKLKSLGKIFYLGYIFETSKLMVLVVWGGESQDQWRGNPTFRNTQVEKLRDSFLAFDLQEVDPSQLPEVYMNFLKFTKEISISDMLADTTVNTCLTTSLNQCTEHPPFLQGVSSINFCYRDSFEVFWALLSFPWKAQEDWNNEERNQRKTIKAQFISRRKQ